MPPTVISVTAGELYATVISARPSSLEATVHLPVTGEVQVSVMLSDRAEPFTVPVTEMSRSWPLYVPVKVYLSFP